MPGDERGLERLAVGRRPVGDHADRLDARDRQPVEASQQAVLVLGQALADLLDRVDDAVDPDEPHDVPGDAAREGDQLVGRPVLERDVPRQEQEIRLVRGAGDAQGHGNPLCRERGRHCARRPRSGGSAAPRGSGRARGARR